MTALRIRAKHGPKVGRSTTPLSEKRRASLGAGGAGMPCPQCGTRHNGVTDSRSDGRSIKRRRACLDCGLRWSTVETEVTRADGHAIDGLIDTLRSAIDTATRALKSLEAIRADPA